MAASFVFGEALALGLASGPACIAACGPVLVPSLLTGHAGLRSNARFLSWFLGARLLGYLLFAVVPWEIGALVLRLPTPRFLLMGGVSGTTAAGILGTLPGMQSDSSGVSLQGALPYQVDVTIDGVTVKSATGGTFSGDIRSCNEQRRPSAFAGVYSTGARDD
jgi:hypothetical protein